MLGSVSKRPKYLRKPLNLQFVDAWDLYFVCFVCLRYSFLRSKMAVKKYTMAQIKS